MFGEGGAASVIMPASDRARGAFNESNRKAFAADGFDAPAGNVRIRVVQVAKWRPTTPRAGAGIVVMVGASESSAGHLFGQKRVV